MSLLGKAVAFHQNISFGICSRYYWSPSKVKACRTDHYLILPLSGLGFLHQADLLNPLLETFKWLTLSKKIQHPSPRALGSVFSDAASFLNLPFPHHVVAMLPFISLNNQERALTTSTSLGLGRFYFSPSNSWLLWVSSAIFLETPLLTAPPSFMTSFLSPFPRGTTLFRTVLSFPS